MSDADRARWDARFADQRAELDRASPHLCAHVGELRGERVLDVACGSGANAVWLAERGFAVTGVDISAVGLARLEQRAAARAVRIRTAAVDLDEPAALAALEPHDSAVVLRYKPPAPLWPQLADRLVPGGRLLVATFNLDHARAHSGHARFWLAPGELLAIDPRFAVLRYEDGSRQGSPTDVYVFERR